MNIVGIIILVIIGLFGIQGMKAGLVRKFSGLLALILSCVLVGLLLPVTVQVLKEKTPVYDVLADQGKRLVSDRLEKSVPADSLSKVEQTKLI